MLYKLILRFCPFQKSGLLTDYDINEVKNGIVAVRLYEWDCDCGTRNLRVYWEPPCRAQVTLSITEDEFNPSGQKIKRCELSEDEERLVTFYNLPMSRYKSDDMVVAEIEVIKHLTIPMDVQELPKEPLKEISAQPKPVTLRRSEPLGACMKKLFGTGEFSDITLSDGTTDIKAHKLILSANSPVFARMFQNPMKENLENRILIEDVPMDALKSLLNFMYSDAIEVSDRAMVRELYIASEKYDVGSLKEICSDVLKSVDITNVIDTLLIADLHRDEVLKQASLDFITSHYSELKSMEKWKNLMKENQSLYLEAVNYVLDKKL